MTTVEQPRRKQRSLLWVAGHHEFRQMQACSDSSQLRTELNRQVCGGIAAEYNSRSCHGVAGVVVSLGQIGISHETGRSSTGKIRECDFGTTRVGLVKYRERDSVNRSRQRLAAR